MATASPAPGPETDRALLFLLLAFRSGLLDRPSILQATRQWASDRGADIGAMLESAGRLGGEERRYVDQMAQDLTSRSGSPSAAIDSVIDGAAAASDATLAAIAIGGEFLATLRDLAARGAGEGPPPADNFPTQAPEPWDPYATRHGGVAGEATIGTTSASGVRYRSIRFHAKGGLGAVFVAVDSELKRKVALKEIQDRHAHRRADRDRFLVEAEITGQLEHPGIVPVYGLGTYEDGRPFYAMRFIHGDSLEEACRAHHDHPEHDAGSRAVAIRGLLRRFLDVCNAIEYAHSRGVLHRDLKPGNIMVGRYGETLVVDWGLARVLGRSSEPVSGSHDEPIDPATLSGTAETLNGTIVGTPGYMSPEQALGKIDELGPASDVYSLGATLYFVLTGRPPFEADSLGELLARVRRGEFPPPSEKNSEVPRALDAVCLKAMALDPSSRYERPSALAEDIERWLADEPVGAWREPWTMRARRWIVRHRLIVTSAAVAAMVGLLAIGVALGTNRATGRDLVDSLESSDIVRAPAIVQQIAGYRFWTDSRLREAYRSRPVGSPERLRVALGLLPVEPEVASDLVEQALTVDSRTLRVVREALGRDHARDVVLGLEPRWGGLDPDRRFRAACLLAEYAPGHRMWDREAGTWTIEHVMGLNRSDPVSVGDWSNLLSPVLPRLVPALLAVYEDRGRDASERALAARLLSENTARPEDLSRLAEVADVRDFESFFRRLRQSSDSVAPLLERAAIADAAGPPAGAEERAKRRAQAAIALLRLGRPEAAWAMLRHSPDPSARSWLIERSNAMGVDPKRLVDRLDAEPEVSARRALILALGNAEPGRLGTLPDSLSASLLARYRDDPDAGTHSALRWLLDRWGRKAQAVAIDRALAGEPRGDRGWYVGPGGRTFTVVRGPVAFDMGSPPDEPGHQPNEARHRRSIGRTFAIADREVTVAEFLEFLKEHPEVRAGLAPFAEPYSPEPECPVNAVSWYWAICFCRWLGEREGIAESEQCYPSIPEILKGIATGGVGAPPADALARTGYRLPTEAEWEFACRAGSTTPRFFGVGESLLPRYAWFQSDSANRSHPAGLLPPNDLGLFDSLGNVREWCHEPLSAYPAAAAGPEPDEPSWPPRVTNEEIHPLRGGAFLDPPAQVSGTRRTGYPTFGRQVSGGLRVARTLR